MRWFPVSEELSTSGSVWTHLSRPEDGSLRLIPRCPRKQTSAPLPSVGGQSVCVLKIRNFKTFKELFPVGSLFLLSSSLFCYH